ncbi:hypothetical protein Trydic_g12101 [Trypoxylus dichotomus]
MQSMDQSVLENIKRSYRRLNGVIYWVSQAWDLRDATQWVTAHDSEEEATNEELTSAFQGTRIIDDDEDDDIEACMVNKQRTSHQDTFATLQKALLYVEDQPDATPADLLLLNQWRNIVNLPTFVRSLPFHFDLRIYEHVKKMTMTIARWRWCGVAWRRVGMENNQPDRAKLNTRVNNKKDNRARGEAASPAGIVAFRVRRVGGRSVGRRASKRRGRGAAIVPNAATIPTAVDEMRTNVEPTVPL